MVAFADFAAKTTTKVNRIATAADVSAFYTPTGLRRRRWGCRSVDLILHTNHFFHAQSVTFVRNAASDSFFCAGASCAHRRLFRNISASMLPNAHRPQPPPHSAIPMRFELISRQGKHPRRVSWREFEHPSQIVAPATRRPFYCCSPPPDCSAAGIAPNAAAYEFWCLYFLD